MEGIQDEDFFFFLSLSASFAPEVAVTPIVAGAAGARGDVADCIDVDESFATVEEPPCGEVFVKVTPGRSLFAKILSKETVTSNAGEESEAGSVDRVDAFLSFLLEVSACFDALSARERAGELASRSCTLSPCVGSTNTISKFTFSTTPDEGALSSWIRVLSTSSSRTLTVSFAL